MDKDYNLLRPFDREAAKQGDKVQYASDSDVITYLDGPDDRGIIAYKGSDKRYHVAPYHLFRMAPLAWVKEKPVYTGDVLYKEAATWQDYVTVTGIKEVGGIDFLILDCENVDFSGTEFADNRRGFLSWEKPKTLHKYWINIYPGTRAYYYPTKEVADMYAGTARLACLYAEELK